MNQLWFVSVPNRGEKADETHAQLQNLVATQNFCRIHRFEIPSLVVGTLDSLMSLSDDLIKINTQIENVVRKIERQYSDVAGNDAEVLRVANEMTVENYLRNFQWDYARYRYQGRQLPDLVSQIQTMVAKVDDELKKLSQSYNEKVQTLSALQRKRTVNLATSDFEDFLPADIVSKFEFLDTDYMKTVVVVVNSQTEAEFLRTYESFGAGVAAYGGTDWTSSFAPPKLGKDDGNFGPEGTRNNETGPPVVPGSAFKIHTEGESSLYGITILKGMYQCGYYEGEDFVNGTYVDYIEPFKQSAREKRFTVRDFVFDPAKAGGVETQIEQAKWEVQQTLTTIIRWCRAHFGEVYSGWIHLKVIRGFVESVLRYGLPVDFLATFVEPLAKKDKQAQRSLTNGISNMREDLRPIKLEADEDDDENPENLPYVCHKFFVSVNGAITL